MLRNSPRSCWIWGNGQTLILPQCWHFCIQLLVVMFLKWSRGGTRSRILDCFQSFRLSSHRWCSIASHRSGCWRDCYLRMQTISLLWLPRKRDMGIPTKLDISCKSKLTLSRVSGYSYAGWSLEIWTWMGVSRFLIWPVSLSVTSLRTTLIASSPNSWKEVQWD